MKNTSLAKKIMAITILLCFSATSMAATVSAREKPNEESLVEAVLAPYERKMEQFEEENGASLGRSEDSWWYYAHVRQLTEEEYQAELEETWQELQRLASDTETVEAENTDDSFWKSPEFYATDTVDTIRVRYLLQPYQEVIDRVNEQPNAVYSIQKENYWMAYHFFQSMSVEEFDQYLMENYENGGGIGRWYYDGYCLNAKEPEQIALREELLHPYLEIVAAMEEEYQISLILPEEERWEAAVYLENLTLDEWEEELRLGLEVRNNP